MITNRKLIINKINGEKNENFQNATLEINKYEFVIIVIQGYADNPEKGKERAKDSFGVDYTGLGELTELSSSTVGVYVYSSSTNNNTKNAVLKLIQLFRNIDKNTKIIMVGHSMGGDNIIELVNEHKDIIINLVITLDIKDASGSGIFSIDDNKIPKNVKNAINYYQTGETIGGTQIIIEDSKSTKGVNILSPGSIHRSIDNDLAPYIKEDCQNFIEGKEAVQIAKERILPTFNPKDSNSEKISLNEKGDNVQIYV